MRDEFVRVREHDAGELSHYSSRTIDFEYNFPGAMGWKELYGLANRTDFDLRQHQSFSGEDLHYFDQAENRKYIPYVIEPTFGVDRTCLILLVDAYDEEEILDVNGKADTRVVLRLHPRVAPYKAAVLPLLKKPELAQPSWSLFETLSAMPGVLIDYDETGNIGKRYRQTRRDRHAVLLHDRFRDARRSQRDRPPSRRHEPGADRDRRGARMACGADRLSFL